MTEPATGSGWGVRPLVHENTELFWRMAMRTCGGVGAVALGFVFLTTALGVSFPDYHPVPFAAFGAAALLVFAYSSTRRPPTEVNNWLSFIIGAGTVIGTVMAVLLGPTLMPECAVVAFALIYAGIFVALEWKARVFQLLLMGVTYALALASVGFAGEELVVRWAFGIGRAVVMGFGATAALAISQRLTAEARDARADAERAREALKEANQHKSEFLASMSHELRTPLNAVIGFSDVLDERLFGDLNEKQAEYVADIRSSGEHLLSLVNDVLDLSKVEAGRMELEVSEVSVGDLAASVVSLFRDQAVRDNVALEADIAPYTGVLEADERKLRQVLVNLVGNALKFTPGGGRVSIAADRSYGHVLLSVSDTGPGIAAEQQERIFEEFAQLGTNGRGPGTGLGLALARRFTELHGGRLEVESTPGQGATFNLKLPVHS